MIPYVDDQPRPRAIHLFAGTGGGLLGGLLLGWRTVCAVEVDRFCRDVLTARQNDGTLEEFPVWDDVRTFDGRPWAGCCDVLCGGFPCQNVSPLGDHTGIRGSKSCLWREFARIAGEVRPRWVFVENSSDLVKLGLDVVLQDFDALGYDAEWECLSAAELGAPHIRDRIWVLAKARGPVVRGDTGKDEGAGETSGGGGGRAPAPETVRVLADPDAQRREEHRNPSQLYRQYIPLSCRVRITEDGWFNSRGGRANPEFVEWLMGWPMGWTALEPLATDRFHTWPLGLLPTSTLDLLGKITGLAQA